MIYLITFTYFIPILAHDLTADELATIAKVKSEMSFDECVGYCLDDQARYHEVQNIVGAKQMSYESV